MPHRRFQRFDINQELSDVLHNALCRSIKSALPRTWIIPLSLPPIVKSGRRPHLAVLYVTVWRRDGEGFSATYKTKCILR